MVSVRKRLFTAGLCLALSLPCVSALAHVTSTSYSTVDVDRAAVRDQLVINANQMAEAPRWDRNGDKRIDQAEAAEALVEIRRIVDSEFFLRANGFERVTLVPGAGRAGSDGQVVLDYQGSLPQPLASLEVHASFERITEPHHQHLMRVTSAAGTAQYAFDHGTDEARIAPAGRDALVNRLAEFVRLGVFHILTGYDHLLFLGGLLITTITVGSLVRVVTAFTIAHSISLVLATLSLVVLPERFVETAIPLTIAYVAVENLWIKSADGRWRLTFFFGLVHGFGFSNVLRQLALPRTDLAVSLFSFNLGVEIGQLAFVLLLFPIVWSVGHSRYFARAAQAASLAILVVSIYLFYVRLVA